MAMEKLKINQVAQELGVTPAGVYKRLKTDPQLVENHVIKEKNTTFITREGIEILREAMQKTPPVSNSTSSQPVEPGTVKHLQDVIANQQRTIDNLISCQAEERQRTDSIIMKLAHDLEDTRRSALAIEMKVNTLLEKPADPIPEILARPAPPVRPWTPPKGKSPAENMGLLERFWTGIVHPERLRRHAEN
jgi:hypothetical protein